MIQLKSNFEISKIRKAGQILALGREAIKKKVAPGVTPIELDKIFTKVVYQNHAQPSFKGYHGFPKTICVSVNDELIHGIPNHRPLEDGDLLSVDMGVKWNGFHADAAFTISVGKSLTENKLLIRVAEEAFKAGYQAIRPKNRLGDVSAAIEKVVNSYKMHTTKDYSGHGIGRELHEEPYVYNFGKPHRGLLLKPGLVIAIEPMILQNSDQILLDDDGWTVRSNDKSKTSHFEHTIAILENGLPEILTK